MNFNIPLNNIPLLLGIFGMCLVASGIWTFRIKDFRISKKAQLIKGTMPMLILLPIGFLLYLIIIEIINVVIVNPVDQAKFIAYLGFISMGVSGLLQWLCDPWSKFVKENSNKTLSEYLEEQDRNKQGS